MTKVVVIGGVAAGLKAAAKIRRNDPAAEITVVEKGSLVSYGACGMPYFVGGDIDALDSLMKTPAGALRNPAFFGKVKNISVLTRTEAVAIDRGAKTVAVKNLETGAEDTLSYDKLVVATGANPVKPPLGGVDLPGIHQLWHPDDAKAIRMALQTGKVNNAVIIGAGLVGMEMAEALRNWDVEVAVVEMKDHVFPAFLDEEVAAAVAKYAAEQGIVFYTGEKVERFEGDGAVQSVVTNQRTLPADLVILAIGVRPNVELARRAGLTIGATGAIAVDEYMTTNDPDIYAGGDCVENTHVVTGKKVFAPMGSTANKHGRIIGENATGGRVKFRGILNSVAVKVLDLNVAKTGLTERDAREQGYEYVAATVAGHDKPHYMPGAKIITIKLVAEASSRRILGAQAFGEGDVAKRMDVIASLITMGGTIDDLFDVDLTYAPPYNGPIDNAAVAANAVMNKLAGRFKGISPLTAKEKLTDEKVTFLDVRSPEEFRMQSIADCKGLTPIPLGELRNRIGELGKDDEIVAFCKISLRGYEAALILEGEGFQNVKVMEGGLAAWPFACQSGK